MNRLKPFLRRTYVGVALDIDGVLQRGTTPIAGARQAVERLHKAEYVDRSIRSHC